MTKESAQKNILIVIPAYNEEGLIGDVIKSVPSLIKVKNARFGIQTLVIDDFSKDKTRQEALAAGARVLRHTINLGAGAATRTGLVFASRHAKEFAYVITIDADGQHKVTDIERLVKFAIKSNADMIIGNRLHEGNKESMPLHRRFGNWGLTFISQILFGIKVKDTQSGLRLIKADAVGALADYTIDRYGFCTEMLWIASRRKLDVQEIPISVLYSEETLAKGQNNWGVINLLIDLMLIRIAR